MALPITDSLVQRAAAQLSLGGWRYTLRQLYYAACAEAELPPSSAGANGEIALGALLILVALILIAARPIFLALGGVGLILVMLGAYHRLTYRAPSGRVLAMSWIEFAERFGGARLRGLIADHAAPLPRPDDDRLILVCDSAESAAAVRGNLPRAQLLHLAPVAAPTLPDPLPWRRVAVLHDASPRGCALPLDLRDSGVDVIDCGLRPTIVDSPAVQVIEGAPARMPRDLSDALTAEEISWLQSGRRVELATLTPARLLALVRAALAEAE